MEVEVKRIFVNHVITWSMSLNHPNHKFIVRATELNNKNICITNAGKLVLQIGAALFYSKIGQTLLQIGAASLLQIRASIVTNWGSYNKLGQPLLQNKAAITNWGKMYCKLGQVLQVRTIITNWGITVMKVLTQNNIKITFLLVLFTNLFVSMIILLIQ